MWSHTSPNVVTRWALTLATHEPQCAHTLGPDPGHTSNSFGRVTETMPRHLPSQTPGCEHLAALGPTAALGQVALAPSHV